MSRPEACAGPRPRALPSVVRVPAMHRPRPHFHFFDPQLRSRYRRDLLQAGLAAAVVLAILFAEEGVTHGVVVVAIASSAFTVFVIPHSIASEPRRVVGGHLVGVGIGVAVSAALTAVAGSSVSATDYRFILAGAGAVGLAVLAMAATDTEHPPAAGTAFGLVHQGVTGGFVLFILTAAVTLALVRALLLGRLRNLM